MIRFVLIAFFLLLMYQVSFSQRPVGNFFEVTILQQYAPETRDFIDTVKASSFIPQNEGGLGCATGIYAAPDSGFVAGNNKYGDLQKAQFYSLHQMGYTAPGILQGVQVLGGAKSALTGTSQVVVQLYAVDTGGFRPGNLIASSNPIPINDIDITGIGNTFIFPAAVSVGDSFFVSVILPTATGDTLAILSTIDDCSAIAGWSWEQWSDNTWHTLLNSWITDIDLAIFPILDLPFNTGISVAGNKEIRGSIFPNPVKDVVAFHYELAAPASFTLSLLNAQGLTVSKRQITQALAGNYTEMIDLKQCAAGLYIVLISSQEGQQSFVVQIL